MVVAEWLSASASAETTTGWGPKSFLAPLLVEEIAELSSFRVAVICNKFRGGDLMRRDAHCLGANAVVGMMITVAARSDAAMTYLPRLRDKVTSILTLLCLMISDINLRL